jgi:hypothetical protein
MSMPEDQQPEDRRPAAVSNAPRGRPAPAWRLIVLGSGFGALSGPFLCAVVNHGEPVFGSLIAAPFLLLGVLFLRAVVVLDQLPWRSALPKVVAVLIGGGVLFMLPRLLALPAPGDFWWRTDLERYAVYCVPFPLAAGLVFSRPGRRRFYAVVCAVAAACLVVSAWPKLHLGATAQTAAVLNRELGLPAAALYTVGIPGAHPTDGYYADDGAVSIAYTIDGYRHPTGTYTDVTVSGTQTSATTFPVYIGYDVALTVYPAQANSPCPTIDGNLFSTLPDLYSGGTDDGPCRQLPNGRWQYSAQGDTVHLTEVERIGDFYVALTVNTQTTGLARQLPLLFAGLHHPDAGELVALGLSRKVPSPVE